MNDSNYIRHESCPKCGSRDNLARYDDGHAYCFGCHYQEKPERVILRLPQPAAKVKNFKDLPPLPDDATEMLGWKPLTWLAKYGIVHTEQKNFMWSEEKQWLIWPVRKDGELVAWQARNFNEERPKPKYITRGSMQSRVYVMSNLIDTPNNPYETDTVIITEDVVSAIKVSRQSNAIPLFGSDCNLLTLIALSVKFNKLGVWLDMDKAGKALEIAGRASQLGFSKTFTVMTDKDPKEYSNEGITCQLQGR